MAGQNYGKTRMFSMKYWKQNFWLWRLLKTATRKCLKISILKYCNIKAINAVYWRINRKHVCCVFRRSKGSPRFGVCRQLALAMSATACRLALNICLYLHLYKIMNTIYYYLYKQKVQLLQRNRASFRLLLEIFISYLFRWKSKNHITSIYTDNMHFWFYIKFLLTFWFK